jgi:hypothetical protein
MKHSKDNEIFLTDVDAQRQASEKRTRDGQSGTALYQLKYNKDEPEIVRGKSTEVGRISDSNRMDLGAIQSDQYTHYAIFRLENRSTVTIIQNTSKELFKVLSLGHNTIKIACSVTITEVSE